MAKLTIEQHREVATEAHNAVIAQIENGRSWVNDKVAQESARRKQSVLNQDIYQLEKDLKHYITHKSVIEGPNGRLIWKAIYDLRVGIEAIICEEESGITY